MVLIWNNWTIPVWVWVSLTEFCSHILSSQGDVSMVWMPKGHTCSLVLPLLFVVLLSFQIFNSKEGIPAPCPCCSNSTCHLLEHWLPIVISYQNDDLNNMKQLNYSFYDLMPRPLTLSCSRYLLGLFISYKYWNDLVELLMQDEELDMSPVEIDDALMIEEDDVSDDEDDDHDEVVYCTFLFY